MNLETAYERGFEEGERLAMRRPWQSLTDDEIEEIFLEHTPGKWGFARAIEQALRERNE